MSNYDVKTSSAEGLLTLLGLRGIGPHSAWRLASRFSTLDELLHAATPELESLVSSSAAPVLVDRSAWQLALGRAHSIIETAYRLGVRVVSLEDADYPELLRVLPDRPLVLYTRGTVRPGRRNVACIGTREPSRFGVEVTRRVVGVLVEKGWSIVSGLAIGVDSLAHEAALDAKGHTVAILANGLDSIYPKKNTALAERILAEGGALLSEQPFGTPAIPRNLVQRDRLQCGMSLATIPMQTDIVGGSMHTVRFTLLQGRLLFAPVPTGSHAGEPKSQGILALTQRTGADLIDDLRAAGEYADLLRMRVGSRAPAVPLRGREDYELLLEQLELAARREPESPSRRKHPTQVGLF
jgi:DNA processing protein